MAFTNKKIIAVIGLGYVGLPLSLKLGKYFNTIAYDKNVTRVNELKRNYDENNEISKNDFIISKKIEFTSNIVKIKKCNFFIVTVPTPVNINNKPDLTLLKQATKDVAFFIKKNDIIVYESTVYPGATEEVCVPILSKISKLNFNKDFFCGYSPERINPGDKKHKLENITKIISASHNKVIKDIKNVYSKIIKKIYLAPSIKIAEAAKVIENTQRDINIAFVNELAIIFDKMNINLEEVLNAANTKWNFLKFQPGLVGGHCIGVDPYYLTYKANQVKYNPKIILSGRAVNDSMYKFISKKIISQMINKNINFKKSRALIIGFSFKENCKDIRNTQISKLYYELLKQINQVDVYDKLVNIDDVKKLYNINLIDSLKNKNSYDVLIFCVAHNYIKSFSLSKINNLMKKNSIIFDLKTILPKKLKAITL